MSNRQHPHDHPEPRPEPEQTPVTGRVRWFNTTRGFGFVVREDGPSEDIFLHYSSIQRPGFRELEEGQRVLFVIEEGDRGPVAYDVLPIANP